MTAKIKWTEEKIAKFVRVGRGKGVGASYKPWVQVSDFSSNGKSRRPFSNKSGRHHELLSSVEWSFFLLLEFSQKVVDIREQFPLPRDETLSIAARLGIKHPTYPCTQVKEVMTTDFFVKFIRNGTESLESFSCKCGSDLENFRVLEKLELERCYFNDLGIPHRLVIDSELSENKVKNILWFRRAVLDDNEWTEYPDALVEHGKRLTYELSRGIGKGTLSQFCANFDERIGAQTGTGLLVARALLWDNTWETDLNQPDLPATPISMFRVAQRPVLRVVGA